MTQTRRIAPKRLLAALVCLIGGALPPGAGASTPGFSALCDTAAITASSESGVPLPVLRAITRTETARRGAPWPWTVNMEGAGRWFDTRAEAETFARQSFAAGARSFDIGCFQINHRWHGQHFASIPAMFDPVDNARYAARFLNQLFAELGSWDAAVGAYHSRTESHAARYLRSYRAHLARLGPGPDPLAGPPAPDPMLPRVNGYPLLQAGAPAAIGSLVPQTSGRGPLLGATP